MKSPIRSSKTAAPATIRSSKTPIRSSKTAAPVTAAKNSGNKNPGKFALANVAVAYNAPGKKTAGKILPLEKTATQQTASKKKQAAAQES